MDHQYFAILLEEHRIKKALFDSEMRSELLGLAETAAQKAARHDHLKLLAHRLIRIEVKLDIWVNIVSLDLDQIAD
jgi:hypothetical protein